MLTTEEKVALQDWVDDNASRNIRVAAPYYDCNNYSDLHHETWRVYGYVDINYKVIGEGKTRWEALDQAKKQIDAWGKERENR